MTFSSLDVHLHTEALLNTFNFLQNLLPENPKKGGELEENPTIPETDENKKDGDKKEEVIIAKKKSKMASPCSATSSLKSKILLTCKFHRFPSTGSRKSKFADIINYHIRADLSCLKVFIRGQTARISEICIEGVKIFLPMSLLWV